MACTAVGCTWCESSLLMQVPIHMPVTSAVQLETVD